MNKIKTSKSIVKRFKKTSSGKFLRRKSSRNHLLEKKTSQHKQKLRKVSLVYKGDILNLRSNFVNIN